MSANTRSSGLRSSREILRERAQHLAARRQAGSKEAEDQLSALVVDIGARRFAFELARVAGITGQKTITWVPGTRPPLVGVINLRGGICPVFCLRSILGLPPGDSRRSAEILLFRNDPSPVGVAVDGAVEVRLVAESDLVAAVGFGALGHHGLIRELTNDSTLFVNADVVGNALRDLSHPESEFSRNGKNDD